MQPVEGSVIVVVVVVLVGGGAASWQGGWQCGQADVAHDVQFAEGAEVDRIVLFHGAAIQFGAESEISDKGAERGEIE